MPECPTVAGFVLAGGQSRRMGRDKALLVDAGLTLVEHAAREVREAAGNVAILGDPARYGHLGIRVVADLIPGQGPLSGLHAALSASDAEWVLLAACDLPNVDAAFLRGLIEAAQSRPGVRCVCADAGNGLEPLCAVYHRSTRSEVEGALRAGRLRMRELAAELGAARVPAGERLVRNINTEQDWRVHLTEKERLT